MPLSDFSLRVDGLEELSRTVNLSLEWAKKPFSKKAALKIREAMHQTSQEIWATEGASVNQKWAPLKASTLAQKKKLYPNRPSMVRTGKLANSFTNDKSPRNIFRHRGNQITWGSRSPYAKYHQVGGQGIVSRAASAVTGGRAGRGLPKRVLFVFTKDLAADIGHTLADDLLSRIKG